MLRMLHGFGCFARALSRKADLPRLRLLPKPRRRREAVSRQRVHRPFFCRALPSVGTLRQRQTLGRPWRLDTWLERHLWTKLQKSLACVWWTMPSGVRARRRCRFHLLCDRQGADMRAGVVLLRAARVSMPV